MKQAKKSFKMVSFTANKDDSRITALHLLYKTTNANSL